uniref:Mos1 transposase HTH domain-containing protein n=1 Tax=Latimeria chalumnae TaxID=7897 RepID=H2ZZ49_LATCH
MTKIEHRVVITFLCKEGSKAKEIHQPMVGVYGNGAPHYSTVAKWYSEFKSGCESLEDDPPPGLDAQQTWSTQKQLPRDRRIKTDAIVTELGISYGSVLKIIHDHLGMSKVSGRWVPRNLSAQDQHQQLESSCKIFYADQANFPACVVTGDETWIHHWDPETKQESMQWKHQASPTPKKLHSQPLANKVMASILWDAKDVLLTDYMPHTRMTDEYYATLMQKFRQAIKEKSKGVLLLHNNAPVHKARVALAATHECGFEQLDHPPYSPDLAPSNYYLFQHLKAYLRGKRFSNDEELMEAIEEQSKDFYFAGIDSLKDKWSKCIEVKGDYIEK